MTSDEIHNLDQAFREMLRLPIGDQYLLPFWEAEPSMIGSTKGEVRAEGIVRLQSEMRVDAVLIDSGKKAA